MLSLQGIEDEEEAHDNFVIKVFRIIIDINIIHRGVHLLQEAEEEVQVSLEEEEEKDLVEEEEEEMDLEQDKDHIVIIVTILVILRKIVLQNYVIWNI